MKRTRSAPSSSWATARAATLSTTRPSLIELFGTLTPGASASTRMYGVMPLSAIHSYMARSRYGRLEVIVAAVMVSSRTRSRAQCFLFFGQTAGETGIAENALAVVVDHARLARQFDAEARQTPDQRCERTVGEAHLGIEEELRRLEQRQAREQGFAQTLARSIGGTAARGNLLDERIPVALHAHHPEAQARPRERIDRHQRRMRITLVEIFADHAGFVEHEVAVDQGRHAVIGIEIDEVLGRRRRVDHDEVVGHTLRCEHEANTMALHVVARGIQRQNGTRSRIQDHAATSLCISRPWEPVSAAVVARGHAFEQSTPTRRRRLARTAPQERRERRSRPRSGEEQDAQSK